MSIFRGGDFQRSCEIDKKTGQMLCKGKQGEKTGKVLGQMGKDGGLKIIQERGDAEVVDRLIQYMNEKATIARESETTARVNKDEFDVGEF